MPAFFTIDPEGTTEYDDALRFVVDERGPLLECLLPHPVAMRMGPEDEVRSLMRAQTVYRQKGAIRMLPKRAVEAATLRSGKTSPTVYVALRFDEAQTPRVERIGQPATVAEQPGYEGSFLVADNLTYEQAQQRIASGEWEPWAEFSRGLLARRRDAGALMVYDVKEGWQVTESGALRMLERSERYDAHVLVQEAMIAVNVALTGWCDERGGHTVHRVQDFRAHEDLSEVQLAYRRMLDAYAAVATADDAKSLAQGLGDLLARAGYSAEPSRHVSMRLDSYGRFTSPLRRFADLVNLRQLVAILDGKKQGPYDEATVARLAATLQALEADQVARRKDSLGSVNRAAHLERATAAVEDLAALPERQFERVVKEAIKAGSIPDELAEAMARREPTAKVVAMLVGEPHVRGDVQLDAVGRITPLEAFAVLGVGASLGYWGRPVATFHSCGPSHATRFGCELVASPFSAAVDPVGSQKEAQAAAALRLLQLRAGFRAQTPLSSSAESASTIEENAPSTAL